MVSREAKLCRRAQKSEMRIQTLYQGNNRKWYTISKMKKLPQGVRVLQGVLASILFVTISFTPSQALAAACKNSAG